MIQASICTIGDEILIGQVVDTNSSNIARALGEAGIPVRSMVTVGDRREAILDALRRELASSDIVITTGGLGPTKDDITKDVLCELSGSTRMVENPQQMEIVERILSSRGLQVLEINRRQAWVPERCEVIPNKLGTAPIMTFTADNGSVLYALPGVPHEAMGAMPDVLRHISGRFALNDICHRNVMVYGLAESALSELIAPWEDALPPEIHLAYLPDPLKGIRLRLSIYSGTSDKENALIDSELKKLKDILGNRIYSEADDTLEATVGRIFKQNKLTLAAAESCTGGEIAHLITTVSGASDYFLGSVTSYAIKVKEEVLGVPAETIDKFGVVSEEVAIAMAKGVRRVLGSDYSVATTGLAGSEGDGRNPGGTVWIAVAGPHGEKAQKFSYKNDRKRNIQRFAATALDFLRNFVLSELNA
ncbi:MAG: CinA family nicotinamide mononucleotide deamidase-related protein [Bacteroidales bacterium]|nr:CinA family nicotinamide mononucleotide deamidase-related protein [Bacteroidales bacterium]